MRLKEASGGFKTCFGWRTEGYGGQMLGFGLVGFGFGLEGFVFAVEVSFWCRELGHRLHGD